ncbi:alpha/beta hydrolase [Gammaproteobacteria bacterium]|nr:alpha/beta hydrolase [Gammaproteobacteria bacterium]
MFQKIILNFFFLMPTWCFKFIGIFGKTISRGHMLDPQTKIFLKFIPTKNLEEIVNIDIPRIRSSYELRANFISTVAKPVTSVSYEDFRINQSRLNIRKYSPVKINTSKSILYFHGGGYAFGSIKTHHDLLMYYSSYLGAEIYSLDYSLSPENQFPAALDDAFESYKWLLNRGVPSKNISLCGDSAGGHLAASLSYKLAQEDFLLPDSQLLIYPMISPSCNTESFKLYESNYFLSASNMRWIWSKLSNNSDDKANPCFDLLKGVFNQDRFPKSIIVTAGFDPLCDEAEKYAYLLHQKHINIHQLHYPSLIHGFASMSRLRKAKLAVDNFLDEYKKVL